MTSAICTLFEKDYHYGLGVLANSLHAQGFRGMIYAGYRGALPPWINGAREVGGGTEYSPAAGLTLRFIPLQTQRHLTNYKPDFMREVWEQHCPKAERLFYFDPDIIIKCRWAFFEEWVEAGVAVCQDVNGSMPDNHPIRHAWRKLLQPGGLEFRNSIGEYFNGGYVGLRAGDRVFLNEWQRVQTLMEQGGADFSSIGVGDRTFPFTCRDQDALNIACMVTGQKISPLGQDGMDFQPGGGGYVMNHALGGQKPWRKKFVRTLLLRGHSPSRADRVFFRFVKSPIRLYPPATLACKRFWLLTACLFGRFLGKN